MDEEKVSWMLSAKGGVGALAAGAGASSSKASNRWSNCDFKQAN